MKAVYLILLLLSSYDPLHAQIAWDDQISIAPSSSGNNHPRIALDRSGNPLVIWYHASRVMFSKWDGSAFTSPRIINPSTMTVAGASWMGPDIASHGDTVYVVFKETPEHTQHTWSMYSYDGGETFSDPVRLDFINDSLARFPTVTTNDDGHPIAGFMKFNDQFQEASWVVSTSSDFGKSFSGDVLASKWSSPDADVCDCCPGAVVSRGDNTVMLYRDNNNNIRDTWAGFSEDGGKTFLTGVNVDQHNWMINACPSSGPDGVIVSDTLYSVFMNGATGKTLVYLGKTSLSSYESIPSAPVIPLSPSISLQNFPRIASDGNAVAIVWKQVSNGREQVVIRFHKDITSDQPFEYDTIDMDNITNVDVAMKEGEIFIVWEDYNAGTVKFRRGAYESLTSIPQQPEDILVSVIYDYSGQNWIIDPKYDQAMAYEIFDIHGRLLSSGKSIGKKEISYKAYLQGYYFLRLHNNNEGKHSIKLLRP